MIMNIYILFRARQIIRIIIVMVIKMGLKHKKYVYVARSDGYYVKVRVLKSRTDEESKYVVVGPKTKTPPSTAKIIREDLLPEKIKMILYNV